MSKSGLSSTTVIEFASMIVMNLVQPKTVPQHKLLFSKLVPFGSNQATLIGHAQSFLASLIFKVKDGAFLRVAYCGAHPTGTHKQEANLRNRFICSVACIVYILQS